MPLAQVKFFSETLRQHCTMDVLLPREYSAERLWPTLYLLHGLSDDESVWQRWSSLERYLWHRPLAVVMPTTLRGFYTDMAYGPAYFSFIADELPKICEGMFHLSSQREDRFAAGLSMGGYGAFKLGLLRPQRYAAVASLSGALDVASHVDSGFEGAMPDAWLAFGSGEKTKNGPNDLFCQMRRLIASGQRLPAFFQYCGTQDSLYPENRRFHEEFGKDAAISYHEAPGTHDWKYWDEWIVPVLDFLPVRAK